MSDFLLRFDLADCERLDQFALLTRQPYNWGNSADWFGSFRGGLYGFYARIHGVVTHYQVVHAWIPKPRMPVETEYHLASILFNMDSAIECFTFALNALGFAVLPTDFRDVTDDRALRRISPKDILGDPGATPPKPPLSGYTKLFPTLQAHWQANASLLSTCFEQHDVSKHRETIYSGGMARQDPPHGFYELLEIRDDPSQRAIFWPMAEIILRKDMKKARVQRIPQRLEDVVHLETLAKDFVLFVKETSANAATDAETNIRLEFTTFKNST